MAITPPDNLPTWADGGSADLSDPGDAKRALGFEDGEAPAAGNLNHQLKQTGEWIELLRKVAAPQVFLQNMVISSDTPFTNVGGGLNHLHIRYIDGLGKYLAVVKGATGNHYAYESVDGITWTNETDLTATGPVSKIASDGTDIVVWRYELELYTSSTGSVAGLTSRGNSPTGGSLLDDCDCVYSPVDDVYIMTAGNDVWVLDNSVDDVHTDSDWTFVTPGFAGADTIQGIAVSTETGKAVVTISTAGSGGSSVSDDGGSTWSAVSGVIEFTTPIYSPASKCFFAFDDANNKLYFMADTSDDTWREVGTDLDIGHFLVHEDFTIGVSGSHVMYVFNTPVNHDGGNPQLNYSEIASHETEDGIGSIVEGDLGGFKNTTPGGIYVIECVGEAKNLVWTRSSRNLCYAKIK